MKSPVFYEPEPLDINDTIKHLQSGEWIYQEVPSAPIFSWITGRAYSLGLHRRGFSPGILFHANYHDLATWVLDREMLVKHAKTIVDAELNGKSIVDKWIKEWEPVNKKFHAYVKRIRSTKLEKLSDAQFLKIFKDFCELYFEEEILPLSNELMIPYLDEILGEIGKKNPNLKDTIAAQAVPEIPSFIHVEESELRAIAKLTGQRTQAALKKHQQKWFFIDAGYTGCPLPAIASLQEKMAKLSEQKNNKSTGQHIQFDEKTEAVLALSRKVGAWKDERKKNNMIGICTLELFAREISRRLQLDYSIVRQAIPRDVPKIMAADAKILTVLKKRKEEGFGWYQWGEKETIISGQELTRLAKAITDSRKIRSTLVKGITASSGTVTGVIRIVNHPGRDTFNAGEILVTSMTRPEFVPLMKRAVAVLCDEGGLLSHAAIVSRELGIPCIVGLKNAMVTLKNGDQVKVDADKGTVTKL